MALAVAAIRQVWAGIGDDFDTGWPPVARRILAILIAAQIGSARDAEQAVTLALLEQGIRVAPDGALIPEGFAGVASDGRDLSSLTYGAVVRARTAEATTLSERLSVGSRFLDLVAQTQIQDAARAASSVAVASREGIGWVRVVNPPCCKRCAVLAGRVYRYSQGFQRHQNCDCSMAPTSLGHPQTKGTIIGPGDVSDLTAAERSAISDGADFNRVINAGRGRDGLATVELAGKGAKRMTPEGIYRVASDRTQAVALLRRYGYLT